MPQSTDRYEVRWRKPKTGDAFEYFHSFAPHFWRVHFGYTPSRQTLSKYLRRGVPVRRYGPRVMVPTVMRGNRPVTTLAAMSRFLTLYRKVASADAAES